MFLVCDFNQLTPFFLHFYSNQKQERLLPTCSDALNTFITKIYAFKQYILLEVICISQEEECKRFRDTYNLRKRTFPPCFCATSKEKFAP